MEGLGAPFWSPGFAAASVGWRERGLGGCGVLPGEYMRGTRKLVASGRSGGLESYSRFCVGVTGGCAVAWFVPSVWTCGSGGGSKGTLRHGGHGLGVSGRFVRGDDRRLCRSSHRLRRPSARVTPVLLEVLPRRRGLPRGANPRTLHRNETTSSLPTSESRPLDHRGRLAPPMLSGRSRYNNLQVTISHMGSRQAKLPRHLWDREGASASASTEWARGIGGQ